MVAGDSVCKSSRGIDLHPALHGKIVRQTKPARALAEAGEVVLRDDRHQVGCGGLRQKFDQRREAVGLDGFEHFLQRAVDQDKTRCERLFRVLVGRIPDVGPGSNGH